VIELYLKNFQSVNLISFCDTQQYFAVLERFHYTPIQICWIKKNQSRSTSHPAMAPVTIPTGIDHGIASGFEIPAAIPPPKYLQELILAHSYDLKQDEENKLQEVFAHSSERQEHCHMIP